MTLMGGVQGPVSSVHDEKGLYLPRSSAIEDFVGQNQDLKEDPVSSWLPVQTSQNRLDVVKFLGARNESGCSILQVMKFADVDLSDCA